MLIPRHQIQVKQAEVAELRSQIHDLGQSQLPGLLQDMATLQVTKVLHGDYDLKIARQDQVYQWSFVCVVVTTGNKLGQSLHSLLAPTALFISESTCTCVHREVRKSRSLRSGNGVKFLR